MGLQLGSAKIEDYTFWERVRIFFVQTRIKERKGNTVRYYKIYKARKVLIREEVFEDRY